LALAVLSATPVAAEAPRLRDSLPDDLSAPGRAAGATRPSISFPVGSPMDDALASPDLRPAIPADDPTADPADTLLDETPRPAAGERVPVVDGDLTLPEETNPFRDGIVEVGEPRAPEDGSDPTAIDARPREEAELFETPLDNPPAGFDPLLFQIEDIDPLRTDRRPLRLFTREPYDPVGVRIGSFVYFPVAEVRGFATSNVLRQTPADGDVAAELFTHARLVSNWSAHALEFNAMGLTSFHDDYPSENDAAWTLEARGRLDVSRLTNLQGLLSHDVRQEGRSAIDANPFGDRAQVTTDSADLTLNHRFNRLSVQLRSSYDDIDFGPTDGAGAGGSSNADRDTRVATEALRATWEFKPSFGVFAEVETNQRRYNVAAVSDGFSRDSDGERYRAGIDFGSTGQVLRGEISLGYGEQDPHESGLGTVEGFLLDANAAWRLSEPTTLLFLASTNIYDTNTAGSAGVLSHTVGIEARHAFRRYLVATAGLSYTEQDYDNVPIEESEVRTLLGVEYYASREWTLFGQWQHVVFDSNQPGGSWIADDVRLGLRWRQ